MNSHRQSYVPSTTGKYGERIIREYELQVQEYEEEKRRSNTIINQLQKQLNEKNKLLKTILEEQDQNSNEFEKLCKENLILKRSLAQAEATNIDLQNDIFNITATNISLTEEQEQMSNLNKSIVAPLKQQLNELTSENHYLQSKLKYVLNEYEKIKEQNKLKIQSKVQVKRAFKIIKYRNIFNNLRKQKNKIRNLEKRYFVLLEKIKHLNTSNIHNANTEIKKHIAKVNSKQNTEKPCAFAEAQTTPITCKDSQRDTCQDESININEGAETERPKVIIFSDNIGRGLVGHMVRKLSKNFILFNICKPDAKIENIIEDLYKTESELSDQDTLVLLISNYYSSLSNRYRQVVIKLLNNKNRKYKLIISGCLYNGHDDKRIYDMNDKISNLAAIKPNVRYLELNYDIAIHKMKFKKVQKKAINHLGQLLSQFRSRSTSTFYEND